MGWPQYAYIGLLMLSIGVTLGLHGRPRTGTHNVGLAIVGSGISFGIVYAGGFFGWWVG